MAEFVRLLKILPDDCGSDLPSNLLQKVWGGYLPTL